MDPTTWRGPGRARPDETSPAASHPATPPGSGFELVRSYSSIIALLLRLSYSSALILPSSRSFASFSISSAYE